MDSTSTFTESLYFSLFPLLRHFLFTHCKLKHLSTNNSIFRGARNRGKKEETGRRDACRSCLQNQFEQCFISSPFPLCCIPSVSLKLWLMSKSNRLSHKAASAAEPLLWCQVAEFSSPHSHPLDSRRNHNLPFQFISCQSKPKACI